jgi:hypothetical protein
VSGNLAFVAALALRDILGMLGNVSRVTRNLSPVGSIDAHSNLEYGYWVLQAGLVRSS